MTTVRYLDDTTVERLIVEVQPPSYGFRSYGYGPKVPTRYLLRLSDGRARRVYIMLLSNVGTPYVVVGGERHILTGDWDHVAPMQQAGEYVVRYDAANDRILLSR